MCSKFLQVASTHEMFLLSNISQTMIYVTVFHVKLQIWLLNLLPDSHSTYFINLTLKVNAYCIQTLTDLLGSTEIYGTRGLSTNDPNPSWKFSVMLWIVSATLAYIHTYIYSYVGVHACIRIVAGCIHHMSFIKQTSFKLAFSIGINTD